MHPCEVVDVDKVDMGVLSWTEMGTLEISVYLSTVTVMVAATEGKKIDKDFTTG